MKKSTLRKVLALMLALVLTFAMSVPAFAATSGSGYTITITPGTYTDTSKTDRFKAYEIFTGRLTEADPDADPPAELTDYEKNQLADIKWGDDIDVDAFVKALIDDEDDLFGGAFDSLASFSDNYKADKVAVEVARILSENATTEEDEDDADVIAAAEAFAKAFAIVAQKNLSETASPVSSTYNGTTGNFSIVVGKPGYYLIVDEPSTDPDAPQKGDIISEHILQVVRDRNVKVKSDTPTVDKEIVTGNGGYEIGQTITFRLTGTLAENFQNFVGDYYYAFVDTMSDGLTLDEESIKVEVYSVKEDGSLDKVVISADTLEEYYELTVENTTDIKIEFENLKDIEGLKAEHVIVVTYNAYINDKAIIGEPETNTVKLEFSNDPYTEDSTTETPEEIVHVETFEIDVIKMDSVTEEKLEGVEFILYKVEKGATPANDTTYYGIFDDDENGTYTLLEEGGWTTNKDNATKLVTIENGILNIKGLGAGTYYLEESVYNGYNALPGPIEITITATYYTAEDQEVKEGTKKVDDLKSVSATVKINGEDSTLVLIDTERTPVVVGKIPLNVKNVPASSLPSTGGIGNYVYYIGGVLLMLTAVVFFFVSRKKIAKN